MLLGTLHFVLTMLPDGLSSKAPYKNSGSCIHYLCDLLKAQDEQVTVSASHVGLMVEKFKEHDVIRGDIPNSRCLDGIFSNSHIHYNNSSLELNYQNKLLPDDVDERYFVFKETKIMTPLRNPTSPMIRNGAHRFSAQRILAYEDNDQLSINSRLQDIVFPSIVSNSPYSIKTFPPPTPLSTYIELETWLNSHIENSSLTSIPLEIKHKLDTCAQHILLDLLEEFKQELNETLEKYGIGSIQQSNFIKQNFKSEEENPSKTFKVDNTVKLFYKVLVELLKNDERQQELRESKDNITYVLKNESFYRSLLSCCLETILFVNSETALEFEEVLEICKVSAFDS